MEKVLITGADGFIGRHLVRELIARGVAVQLTTRRPNRVFGRTSIATGNLDFDFDWCEALKGCSHVVHLAGRSGPIDDKQACSAQEFSRTNATATAHLADQAARAGVNGFILLSSISVYNTAMTQLTAQSIPDPDTDFGRSKLQAEQGLQKVCAQSEMTYTILRAPLVYGPRVKQHFLQLLKLAASKMPLPIKNVKNACALMYVGNLTSLILTTLHNDNARDQIFLVSDGQDLSTPALIKTLSQAMGHKRTVWSAPSRLLSGIFKSRGLGVPWKKLVQTQTVDSSPVRQALNWRPPHTSDQGLNTTARWYRDNKNR